MAMVLLHWAESGARVAASAFVSGIWQGLVLVGCVALCLRMFPKTTAAVRFVVWSAVFAVLALLPFVHRVGSGEQSAATTHAGVVHALHVDVRWGFAIAAVWLGLSLVRAARLAQGALRIRQIWKRATPVVTDLPGEVLRSGRRTVEICTSTDVETPSVIGFFSPRVLIPASLYERVTGAELEQIVLHEMGHLRRSDDWINLLQKIGLVLLPLNPALVWIEKRLCFERELACDDSVLRLTKAPKAYATCLTTLAEHRLERRGLALTLGAWAHESELSRRVYSILGWSEGMRPAQSRAVFGGLMVVLLGGATGLSRCPQLVSFSQAALPVAIEARSLALPAASDAEYQPVVYRPGAGNAAHETLLKAAMPVASPAVMLTGQGVHRQSRKTMRSIAVSQRAKKARKAASQPWVVLTSWNESRDARMVMTVSQEQVAPVRVLVTSYAAVPTPGGWLVIQL